ncbi:MAG: TonB-dependent receptor [Saprospiraceae bacterium]|nr:TonB-dependent receptor [Saprospiraceae bacterium]
MRNVSDILVIFILVFLFSVNTAIAQNHVKGEVKDAGTGEPLIGANVTVKNDPSLGTVTDFDGHFDLKIENFPVTLNISYIGYTAIDYVVENKGQKVIIKIGEEPVTIDLGVEIKGQRVSEKQRAAPLTIESLDAKAIKQTASTDFYNGLGSLKGVDLTTASLGFTVINTRGFNSTSPVRSLQTIDGVDNQSPGLNFSLGNFLGASELDINKVDLVVGASSAFYGPNAFNGVIAMETKNPFFTKGLSASLKIGERNLLETAFRFADVLKNKAGMSAIAYKLNFSYLKAYDWVADNYDPVTGSSGNSVFNSSINPGGANKVNVYGDEYYGTYATLYDPRAGLNSFHRQGYREIDVVDYNTKNLKAGAAIHIRTKPSKDFESPELVITSNFGYGTTVYQGDNRFRLDGIQFYQQKIEFRKKDKYFIRAYATNEDAGNSYDPYFTAQKMLEASGENEAWQNSYVQWWSRNDLGAVWKKMKDMGYPADGFDAQIKWQQDHKDLLDEWHKEATQYANTGNKTFNTQNYYQPGTARFDSLFNDIKSRKNNFKENGTKFFDRSALYHLHGEYKFQSSFFKELTVGANGRVYRPYTQGTIFSDSISRITNVEAGVYAGASKAFNDFTVSIASRLDKNQNFNLLFSPAASVVWKPSENNYLRVSFSSAIRNPTLSDQYLNLKVGPAQLIGNLNGYPGLITLESFNIWRNNPSSPFVYKDIAPIRPEKVKTLEIGYRTTLLERLYLDASVYRNAYNDFIGYQVGLVIPEVLITPFPGSPPIPFKKYADTKVFRVAVNSVETVVSQGFALGYNYYFNKYYAVNGNYSYNALTTKVQDTTLVPAFNTPKNKFNVGISGRDIPIGSSNHALGFNINYKWIQGFTFEGSPQFTGAIPTYDLIDAQVNYNMPKQNLTFKIGASNALNNKQFQTYGGPRIGRMAYITVTYDFKEKI